MCLTQSVFSDNIASSIASLDLSLKTRPNWQGFLSKLENQTQATGLAMVCTHPDFDYEIRLQQGEHSELLSSHVISGCSEGWQYEIKLYFSHDQQLDDQCFHIPMRLALKNMNYHFKHGLIKTCIDSLGLGVLHIDQHSRVIETNSVADKIINSKHLKVRHGKVSIAEHATWVAERIFNYQAMKQTSTECHPCMSLTVGDNILHSLLLPIDEQCSGYLLIVCLNERKIVPEVLQCLMPISQSQAVVAAAFMQGASADQVANQTGYSTHTVYSYIKNLYKEKDISRQAQLTAMLLPKLPHYNDSANEYLYENCN